MYREIKIQVKLYSVKNGLSRSFFWGFLGFFIDNIGWYGKEGVKEWVLRDTSRLALKKAFKFPVFRRTSPVGAGSR